MLKDSTTVVTITQFEFWCNKARKYYDKGVYGRSFYATEDETKSIKVNVIFVLNVLNVFNNIRVLKVLGKYSEYTVYKITKLQGKLVKMQIKVQTFECVPKICIVYL